MVSEQVQQILAEYQLPKNVDDATLRSTLLAAGWHERDVEAFARVRAGVDAKITHRSSLHKLMGVDHRLHPDTVVSMLNVSLTIDSLTDTTPRRWNDFSLRTVLSVVTAGCVGAVFVTLFGMWWMELGWFHPLAW